MGSYPLLPGGGNTYVNYLQFSLKGDLSLHLWQEKGLNQLLYVEAQKYHMILKFHSCIDIWKK